MRFHTANAVNLMALLAIFLLYGHTKNELQMQLMAVLLNYMQYKYAWLISIFLFLMAI